MVILSSRKVGPKHISYNTVLGLENEFLECMENRNVFLLSNTVGLANRVWNKLFGKFIFPDWKIISRIKRLKDEEKVFFSIMGLYEAEFHINTLQRLSKTLILYIFDCWESDYSKWEEVLTKINPYGVCFAYKKSAEYFKKLGFNTFYLPQSMDANIFHLSEMSCPKKRLFIQMGRKVDFLHQFAIKYMEKHNLSDTEENYVYERVPGKVVFPNAEVLAKEISVTKFFFAAPQMVHNKKKTGDISETTARYYEAMACKTLIIGIKPRDSFDELFPYPCAMIEIDVNDYQSFEEAVNYFLQQPQEYSKIVDKNYEYVMRYHRWKNRYDMVIKHFN